MIRLLFVAISLLFLLAVLGVWLSGPASFDGFLYRDYTESSTFMIVVDDGQLRISHWLSSDPPAVTGDSGFERYGFGYLAEVNITPLNKVNRMYRIMVPMWVLITFSIAYPLLVLVRGPIARLRRHRLNRCIGCGYLLIGNTSGTCPECGLLISNETSALFGRPASRIEQRLWTWSEKLLTRRAVMIVVALLFAAAGLRVLLDRPWESPLNRAYRICGANDVSRDDIDTAILGYGGGFAPGTPMFEAFVRVYSASNSSWSEACNAAVKDAVSSGTKANAPVGLGPSFRRR